MTERPDSESLVFEHRWAYISSPLETEIRRRVGHEVMRMRAGAATPTVSGFIRRAIRAYFNRHPLPTAWRPERPVSCVDEADPKARVKVWFCLEPALVEEIDRRVAFSHEGWDEKTADARSHPRLPAHQKKPYYPPRPTRSRVVREALREWMRRNPA